MLEFWVVLVGSAVLCVCVCVGGCRNCCCWRSRHMCLALPHHVTTVITPSTLFSCPSLTCHHHPIISASPSLITHRLIICRLVCRENLPNGCLGTRSCWAELMYCVLEKIIIKMWCSLKGRSTTWSVLALVNWRVKDEICLTCKKNFNAHYWPSRPLAVHIYRSRHRLLGQHMALTLHATPLPQHQLGRPWNTCSGWLVGLCVHWRSLLKVCWPSWSDALLQVTCEPRILWSHVIMHLDLTYSWAFKPFVPSVLN